MAGRLIDSAREIGELLASVKTVAVLGIKPESLAEQPAHYVPAYAQRAGMTVIPVPVYYPEVTEILGVPVVRDLAAIDVPVDLVDVFRRPADLAQHLDALLKLRPRAVWLQSGIAHEGFAKSLTDAGVDVVMDRCLMIELQRRGR